MIRVAATLAAFLLSALVLWALGVDPLAYYSIVLHRGLLTQGGLQASVNHMAAPLLMGASLIVAFRAGIWNLGGDAQFLLAAVFVAATAPGLAGEMPRAIALPLCLIIGLVVGAAWGMIPALLKAFQGVNEIITTLMMSFLGVSLAHVLVKLVFFDPDTTVPQTQTLAVIDRLPRLGDSRMSSGVLVGLAVIALVHWGMQRTAFGLRLRMVGASPRAALHAGLPVPLLTLATFGLSAGLAGLAGAVEIISVQGNARADWDPAYALPVIPLVFLARLNGLVAIPLMFVFGVLTVGGESAARRMGVPNEFTLVSSAFLLICLALAEMLEQRRPLRAQPQ